MAIDITLQVMSKQAAHSLPAKKEPGRWLIGQIAGVLKSSTLATKDGSGDYHINEPIGSKAHVYIHIKNVPGLAAKRIRDRLSREQRQDDDTEQPMTHRSAFRFHINALPAPKKAELVANKELTLFWPAVKTGEFLKRSHNDPLKNGVPITDEDLE